MLSEYQIANQEYIAVWTCTPPAAKGCFLEARRTFGLPSGKNNFGGNGIDIPFKESSLFLFPAAS
jgi:hypothetical protein